MEIEWNEKHLNINNNDNNNDFIQNLIQKKIFLIKRQYINEKKGRGLFSLKNFEKKEILFFEKPLVAMQHINNRIESWTCANCFRFVGTFEQQFQRIQTMLITFQEEVSKDSLPSISKLPMVINDSILREKFQTAVISCSYGCGEVYCSEICRNENFQNHHCLLCVGQLIGESHPLILFKKHAIQNNELFILAAQVIASIFLNYLNNGNNFEKAIYPFISFHKKHYWEVRNFENYTVEDIKNMLQESIKLLKQAFLIHPLIEEKFIQKYNGQLNFGPLEQLFTLEFYSLLMGLFELNNHTIDINSPLQYYLNHLGQLPEPDKINSWNLLKPTLIKLFKFKEQIYLNQEEEEGSNSMEDENLQNSEIKEQEMKENFTNDNEITLEFLLSQENLFPQFEGLGLYPIGSTMNHSCCPNCSIKFEINNTAFTIANVPIHIGEELTISYIENENPLEERQEELEEYGFICDCQKCLNEKIK